MLSIEYLEGKLQAGAFRPPSGRTDAFCVLGQSLKPNPKTEYR